MASQSEFQGYFNLLFILVCYFFIVIFKGVLDAKFIGFPLDLLPHLKDVFLHKFGPKLDFKIVICCSLFEFYFYSMHLSHNRVKRSRQMHFMMTLIVDGNYGQARLPYQMGMNTGEKYSILSK